MRSLFLIQVSKIYADEPWWPGKNSVNLTSFGSKVEKYFRLMDKISKFPPEFDLGSSSGLIDPSAWAQMFSSFSDVAAGGNKSLAEK